ncbi:MAG: hypothetical protein WD794_06950 [Mycobacteriales bacterium]
MTSPSRRGVVGAALLALLAPIALATPASASTTANEIVYTFDENNDGIYSVVLRDLESRRLTTVLPADTTNEWIYDEPELSPDGGRIALSTDRAGGVNLVEGIAVVNRDGSGFRRLTEPPQSENSFSLDVSPAWSPDGTRLVFTRISVTTGADSTQAVDTTVFTVAAAGGTAAPLTGAEDGYTADWSPDGKKIVFAAVADGSTDDSGPLTVVNADGSGGRTPLGPSGYSPAWSPDGSTIAYATVTVRDSDTARGQDVAQIATVPATGGTGRVLAATRPGSAPSVAEYPAWTPDGESIVYDVYGYSSTDAFPPGDLWAVDRNGVRAGRVTATPGDEAQVHVQGPKPVAVSAGTESTYVPVTPKRVLDTREGLGAPTGKIGPAGTVELAVRGLQTAPTAVPADATAVVLNVTVTGTTASTDVRAYPSGTPVPGASNLNAGAGSTVPNLVTVAIGGNGGVTLRNSGGTVHLIADIAGYYVPGNRGAGFAAVDPSRILDTRSPAVGAPAGKVGPEGFLDLRVTGALSTADGRTISVPADARAVVLNVTVTGATSATDIRVYPTPTDGSVPTVSNLNVRAGQTVPNLVTVAVGEGGKVRLRNLGGTVNLIADLAGYYSPGATGRFVPVSPARFLDTRSGVGGAPIPVTAEGFVDLKVAAAPGSTPHRGVPAGATAAVLNLTGTGVTASTDVRAYPVGAATVPTVSNLNLSKSTTRANLSIVKVGTDGRIRIRNGAGQVNLIGDLAGYMIG